MKEVLRLGALTLLIQLAAPGGASACVCEEVRRPGEASRIRPISQRPIVFVGTALRVERRAAVSAATLPGQRVRFLVEAAWRGVEADTMWLDVYDDAPCADYVAGSRYLVAADPHEASVGRARTAICDGGLLLEWAHPRGELDRLGPPTWIPPQPGDRRIDEQATALGDPPPAGRTTVGVGIGLVGGSDDVERVSIADQALSSPLRGILFELPEGLYQVRIEWKDGSARTTYLDVSCGQQSSSGRCLSHHFLRGLRIDWPGAPAGNVPGSSAGPL